MVCRWPCGAKRRRRSPLRLHPRSGAMLVSIQGLVDENQTARILACRKRERRLRAASERACSGANSVFLNRSPSRRGNNHNCIVRDLDPAFGKIALHTVQGQVGR